jgi:hypothetical protein
MPAHHYPTLACDDLMRAIEVNRSDRGASDCRQTDNQQSICTPAEMIGPAMGTRIIQSDDLAALRVSRLHLRTLPLIALAARASQILGFAGSTSSDGHDVLDAQRAAREALIGTTIPTAMARIGKDLRGELNRIVVGNSSGG